MQSVLLRWGPLVIHSYPALVNLGLLVGGLLVYLRARRQGTDVRLVMDTALSAALGGLVLSRAAYVGVHWDYYAQHPGLAIRPWDGGLLWQGALLGGLIAAAAAAALRGASLTQLLDVLTPGAAALAVFAWMACFMVGCAWGIETYPGQDVLWALSLDLPNLYGIREPRVAVQLLGAGWDLILLTGVLALKHRPRRGGTVFSLWLTLHSLGSLALGFLRADDVMSVAGWRIDQLANLLLTLVGAFVLGALLVSRLMDSGS